MLSGRGRTFRVFVSSTFSDLKAERNALARWVFPKLRTLCEGRGYSFQAVDLRWGIRDEAALDHRTVQICLEEVRRCQRLSPKPNFIVLLGDRYGWRPPPSVVEAEEFRRLVRLMPRAGWRLFLRWYRRDWNAQPPEYVLQPRTGDYGGRYAAYERWQRVERRLQEGLAVAAELAGLDDDARRKYEASATEQEIVEGALKVKDAGQHVFAFFRRIRNLGEVAATAGDEAAQRMVDTRGGEWDDSAWKRLRRLKAAVRERVGGANVWKYRAQWEQGKLVSARLGEPPEGTKPEEAVLAEATLCGEVYRRLAGVIAAEMDRLDRETKDDPLKVEQGAHAAFRAERVRAFVGREEPLEAIARYVKAGTGRPLVVHGPSGSGKSALMAKAVEQAKTAHPGAVIVERYIGASPATTEIATLLRSLVTEITREYGGDENTIPATYEKLVADFPDRLKLATASKPLMVFIDALDQLGETGNGRGVFWLPRELPEHVRVVVSTLPEAKYGCLPALKASARPGDLVELQPMTRENAGDVLQQWLDSVGRTVKTEQRDLVLERFCKEGSPLWLKLAFEEARRWRSYGRGIDTLADDVPAMFHRLFERLSSPVEHGQRLVSHTLALLAASRYGLSEQEMLDLLWRDTEIQGQLEAEALRRKQEPPKGLPPAIWSRLYWDLEPYLREHYSFGEYLLDHKHIQFREAAAAQYLRGDSDAVHRLLGHYFAERADPDRDGSYQRASVHSLSELPYHWCHGLCEEYLDLIADFRFLDSKLRAFGPYRLLEDYDHCLGPYGMLGDRGSPIRRIRQAIALSSHVLARRPNELASQLYGRLRESSDFTVKGLLNGAYIKALDTPTLLPTTCCLFEASSRYQSCFAAHCGPVWHLALTPDDRYLISASDRRVLVHEAACLANCRDVIVKGPNVEDVRCLALIGDGSEVAIGLPGGRISIVDIRSAVCRLETCLGSSFATAMCGLPEGLVACGHADGQLVILDSRTGEHSNLAKCGGQVTALDSAMGGKLLLCGSDDGMLRVYEVPERRLRFQAQTAKGRITGIAVLHESQYANIVASGGTILLYDLESGTNRMQWYLSRPLGGLCYNKWQGTLMLYAGCRSVTIDKTLIGVNLLRNLPKKPEITHRCHGHAAPVRAMVIGFGGSIGFTGDNEGIIAQWDLSPNVEEGKRVGHTRCVTCITPVADEHLVLTGSDGISPDRATHSLTEVLEFSEVEPPDNRILRWKVPGADVEPPRAVHEHGGRVERVLYARKPRLVLSSGGNKVVVSHLASGQEVRKCDSPGDRGLAVSSDGLTTICEADRYRLAVLDTASWRVRRELRGHRDNVWFVVFHPDGRRILSAGRDGYVILWDILSGKRLDSVRAHAKWINYLGVTSDGRYAITSCAGDRCCMFEIGAGSLAMCSSLNGFGQVLALSPDGSHALACLGSRSSLTRIATATQVRCTELRLKSAEFTMDGAAIACIDGDGVLRLLGASDLAELATYTPDSKMAVIRVSLNGDMVTGGDASGRLHILKVHGYRAGPPVVVTVRWRTLLRKPRYAFRCPSCEGWTECGTPGSGMTGSCRVCGMQSKLEAPPTPVGWALRAR